MDIDSMLNKYFEGETSTEEEQMLRKYFNQENLPKHLKEVSPIFTYIENERIALEALKEITDITSPSLITSKKRFTLSRSFFISAIAAASITAVLFLFSPNNVNSSSDASESYAWINGKRIIDKNEIKMFAEKSLDNVSSTENIFMEQMNAFFEVNIGDE